MLSQTWPRNGVGSSCPEKGRGGGGLWSAHLDYTPSPEENHRQMKTLSFLVQRTWSVNIPCFLVFTTHVLVRRKVMSSHLSVHSLGESLVSGPYVGGEGTQSRTRTGVPHSSPPSPTEPGRVPLPNRTTTGVHPPPFERTMTPRP